MDGCPPAETLAELVEARLSPDQARALHHHVRTCQECRLVLAGLADSTDAESLTTLSPRDGDLASVRYEPGAHLGRFVIEGVIGIGGMGRVYAARDPELGRQVALKVLRVGGSSQSDADARRARLLREAQAMARLSHPNVVTVFEVGEFEDRLFVVMEKVEGANLSDWLRQEPRPQGEVLDVFHSAGRGLLAAHAAGIVHRDFKPDNVLVGLDGRVRVTDFGLARPFYCADELPTPLSVTPIDLEVASPADTLTPLGALVGTPAYMAPEQLSGLPVDARADVFSFCTSLWEALYKQRPFSGKTLAELKQRIDAGEARPGPTRAVPAALRLELLVGLSADPARRQPSMEALLAALAKARTSALSRPRRLLAIGAAAALVASAAAALLLLVSAGRGAARVRRAVAVAEPMNLGGSPEQDWLSPALAELLGTEATADGSLRLVPAQTLSLALADLGASAPRALDPGALKKLQQGLGADLVITGGFTVSAEGGKPPQVKLELRLWDASTGVALASMDDSGDEERLSLLASRIGTQLRRALGSDPVSRSNAAQASFPSDPEAARLYSLGLAQLRSFEAAASRESLSRAAELAPDNPRVLVALAAAHEALGYVSLARDAALRAYAVAASLPRDERLRVELAYRHANKDYARATEIAQALLTFFPDDVESGLRLAEEQLSASRYRDAIDTVRALRKLPEPARNDARLYLVESQATGQLGDFQAAREAAARAGQLAEATGARWLLGRARYAEAEASRLAGELPRASALYEEARRHLAEAGDRSGVARVQTMAAAVLADDGDLVNAREQFERALGLFEEQGNRRSAAALEHNLSVVLRRLRELPEALVRASKARDLYLENGDRGGTATSLALRSHVKQDQGDLAGAAADLIEAIEIRRQIKHRLLSAALAQLAAVRLAQGQLAKARALLLEAQTLVKPGDKQQAATVEGGLAQLALTERPSSPDAVEALRRAAERAQKAHQHDDAALLEGQLAAVRLHENRLADAQAALERGRAAVAGSTSAIAWPLLSLGAARLQARQNPAERRQARAAVDGVLTQALRTGVAEDEWQARLALAELSEPGEAALQLRLVLTAARERGFEGLAGAAERASATLAAR